MIFGVFLILGVAQNAEKWGQAESTVHMLGSSRKHGAYVKLGN